MMTQSLVTIVIPVYNRADLVGATLRSVASQTARPLEVIIVDNGSTDSTLEVLGRWAAEVAPLGLPVKILSEKKRGAAAARNSGLAEVTTPYVMFFDSDDIMAPNHVADFVRAIEADPEADILGREVTIRLLDGTLHSGRFTDCDIMVNQLLHSVMATQRYVVRTELIKRVGGWNEELLGWDDWELGVRLLLESPRVKVVAGPPSVEVMSQTDSITGVDFSSRPEQWEAALDAVERAVVGAGRGDLVRWVDLRRVILASYYRREGAKPEADRLLSATLSRCSAPLRLRLLYRQHLIMGRGTSFLGRMLL